MMRWSRRSIAFVGAAFCAGIAAATPAMAEPLHGLSNFGDLKYPADFKHFDYVNPDAPKGGRLATIGTSAITTFDSFNGFILKGDAAQGLGLTYDTLMARATDEPDSIYGLVASAADLAADGQSVTFKLRPEARFSDGSRITADDVVFSFETLKAKGHPQYRFILRDVVKAEAIDGATVRYQFRGEHTRGLPLLVAGLAILSKAHFASRNFEETTLQPILGSGPYMIGDYNQGKFITYKRRNDYWGKDLAVNRGRWNFDEIRFDYYRDRTAALQGFKAGEYDLREEFTARDWMTAYDFPAVKDGRVIRVTLPNENPSGTQGFFFNTRRAKFADPRVRHAFDLAFDYEWTNANIFSGIYLRTESFFENSQMKALGKPSAAEAALLEPFRAQLPAEVFGEPYVPQKSDGSGKDRRLLLQSAALLDAAGYTLRPRDEGCGFGCRVLTAIGLMNGRTDFVRKNAKGETLNIEFMITDPSSERIVGPYAENLKRLGVEASLRRVDPAQYERRVKEFDYDVVITRFVLAQTPGVELKAFYGSEAAGISGSRNLAGIKNPVVDALIDRIVAARSRAELNDAARALDRVLRASHYWVSHYYKASHHVAYWDRFDFPKVKPRYDRGIEDTWWISTAKTAKLTTN